MPKLPYTLRAISYIALRFLFAKKYLVAHSDKYKLHLKFRTQDGGGRKIFKTGVYEEELSDFLVSNLTLDDGDVILDVGANIGWYSVLLSHHIQKSISIYSFEPDPDNFSCLQFNVESNHCQNVYLHRKGVSDRTETRKLYLYKKSNIGRHSMLEINDGPTVDIETVSLDEFVRDNGIAYTKVKFLKIDIEGYELLAFKGATQLLKFIPQILMEFSPGYMKKGGLNPGDVLALLSDNGYEPSIIEKGGRKPVTQDWLIKQETNVNVFWEKKAHSQTMYSE